MSNGTTVLAKRQDSMRTVQDLLLKSKAQIQMALPAHMASDRMIRVALTTIRQTPDLLNCPAISLVKCVMQAAALGLEPDPLLGRAYIVPFKNKQGVKEATLIIGYKGFIDLARRSGEMVSIEAHCVFEQDEFRYEFGTGECLVHRPAAVEDRGNITHAWAMARFKGGGHQFDVMDFWELEAIRKMSKQPASGPWRDHTPQMYRKTVLRRLANFLPLSPNLVRHLAAEEMIEGGLDSGEIFGDDDAIDVEVSPDPDAVATPTGNKSAELAAKIGGKPAQGAPVDKNEAGSAG